MPMYKIPERHDPPSVEALKIAFSEVATRDILEADLEAHLRTRVWHTMVNAIAEVLYVRGMDHNIVDALLKEWRKEALSRAEVIRKKRKEKLNP